MPKTTYPRHTVVACALAACFAAGFGGAHTGAALETRVAVAHARDAAQAVNSELTALEESLEQADAAVRAAAFAADEREVVTAAAQVDYATARAATTTGEYQAVFASTDAPAPAPAAQLRAYGPVAEVLDGEAQTAAAANEATAHLEQVRDELDDARTLVDSEVSELEEVRGVAKHDDMLATLDTLLDQAPAQVESAATALTQVGTGVVDQAVLGATTDAAAELDSARATAQHVDRSLPTEVKHRISRVEQAQAVLDLRVANLKNSHEEWVAEQNIAITESNQTVLASHEVAVEKARQQHQEANREQVAARSNGWTGRPVGTVGSNGRLAWDSMCELDFATHHRLQCDAAAALMAANAQYFAETGKQLVLTDSYRSYSLQVRTRALKPGTAARPGTSNHGWGMAVDMDHPSATWLSEHGADYGWVHPRWARPGGARPEWWHLEYVATDIGAFSEPAPVGMTEPMVSVFDSGTSEATIRSEKTQITSANVTAD